MQAFSQKNSSIFGMRSKTFLSALQNYFERTPENIPRPGTNNTRHLFPNTRHLLLRECED